MESIKFKNYAPMLNYCQKSLKICCFGGLLSDFASIKQTKTANVISLRIEESLKIKVGDCIDFAHYILKNKQKLRGGPRVYSILR